MPDEMVEKAQTLDDAIDNALIAWGMGWDMDGVMACLKEAKDRAALSAAHAEPVGYAVPVSLEQFREDPVEKVFIRVFAADYLTARGKDLSEYAPFYASPSEAAIRADERAAKALDLIAKMAGNVVFNGKQSQISHEDHMRAWADIEATAIRARGET